MSRQEVLDALLAERFSGPVREYRAQGRTAPIAELLDLLADEQSATEISLVQDTA